MMKTQTFKSFVVAAVMAVVAGSATQAQLLPSSQSDASRILRFGFGGGVVVPRTGATIETIKTGVQGQGFLLIQLPGGLPALRANFDYAKMKFDRPVVNGGDATSGDRTTLDGVAGMKIDLIHGPIRPYLLAGVGAFDVKDVIQATSTSTSNVNLGVDGGAGISLKLGPIDAFVESRLQNVWTKKSGFIDAKSVQSFPISFGLLF
jgi:opacity protein-like surface antigen